MESARVDSSYVNFLRFIYKDMAAEKIYMGKGVRHLARSPSNGRPIQNSSLARQKDQ